MQNWDIFCRIVDNFGDIGVTWRLSRQLVSEHGISVRLWIDDLETAGKLIPGLNPELSYQQIYGVEIAQWDGADQALPAEVVIEAFACELPSGYLVKMAAKQPKWINLEYLSAEPWVEGFHAQQSRHPTLPLTKHFFFPGFSSTTGGLLRERDLMARRDAFVESTEAKAKFQKKLQIPDRDALKVSLFCYPQAPLSQLLGALAQSPRSILCLVPNSGVWPAISQHLHTEVKPGLSINHGNLTLLPLRFLTPDEYDQLLWLCDINFVRGEDSWVRAIWAGKPMVWQPYRQPKNTHMEKLAAFLHRYSSGLGANAASAMQRCHASWSSETFPESAWRDFLEILPELSEHAATYSEKLARELDLASKLVIFCRNT